MIKEKLHVVVIKEKFHVDEPMGNQKRRRGARPDGLDQQKSRRSGARALLPNAPSDANRAQHRFDGYCGPTGAPTHHGKTAISSLSLPNGSLEHPGYGAGDRTRALPAGAGTVVS